MAKMTQEGLEFIEKCRADESKKHRAAAIAVGATFNDGNIKFRDEDQQIAWDNCVTEMWLEDIEKSTK